MSLKKQYCFTLPGGEDIHLFTLENKNGTRVSITNYGAIITSFFFRDTNIVLGFDDPKEYLSGDYIASLPFFGCEVGRYANRIANASFTIDGITYKVSANIPPHQLHGGFKGFQQKVWEVIAFHDHPSAMLEMQYLSPDGEEGFPGNLLAKLRFILNDDDELLMETTAVTDKPTAVNLTHHDYFNMNGEGRIDDHTVKINASNYLGQDDCLVVDGSVLPVENSGFDFRKYRKVNATWDAENGYDQTFILDKKENSFALAATCIGDQTGLQLDIYTDEPAVHFYTGKWIPEMERNGNKLFGPFSGLCFETQVHPNAVNIPHFPNTILRPGEKYSTKSILKLHQAVSK